MKAQLDERADARTWALAGELRVIVGKLRRKLKVHAHFGELTGAQVSVLGRLERDGPATATALARAEGMRPQSMGAIVAVLEAAGMITGAPDPHDGRQTILSLSAACKKWVKASRAAREDWLFRALQTHLTATEQRELAHAVTLLDRLLD